MKINVENLFLDIELKFTDKKHRIQVLELQSPGNVWSIEQDKLWLWNYVLETSFLYFSVENLL